MYNEKPERKWTKETQGAALRFHLITEVMNEIPFFFIGSAPALAPV